jgi:hypothetical protein
MEVTGTSPTLASQTLSTSNRKPSTNEDANTATVNKPLTEQLKTTNRASDVVLSLSKRAEQRLQESSAISSSTGATIGNEVEARAQVAQLLTAMTTQPDIGLRAYNTVPAENIGRLLAT